MKNISIKRIHIVLAIIILIPLSPILLMIGNSILIDIASQNSLPYSSSLWWYPYITLSMANDLVDNKKLLGLTKEEVKDMFPCEGMPDWDYCELNKNDRYIMLWSDGRMWPSWYELDIIFENDRVKSAKINNPD